jgi:hypothetical protein
LSDGATVIPVICTSNETHITNLSDNKKAWLVYLTIGNIPFKMQNKQTNMAMIPVGLLLSKLLAAVQQIDFVEKPIEISFMRSWVSCSRILRVLE